MYKVIQTHAERRLSRVSSKHSKRACKSNAQMFKHQMNKRNENLQPHPNRLARLLWFLLFRFIFFFPFCFMWDVRCECMFSIPIPLYISVLFVTHSIRLSHLENHLKTENGDNLPSYGFSFEHFETNIEWKTNVYLRISVSESTVMCIIRSDFFFLSLFFRFFFLQFGFILFFLFFFCSITYDVCEIFIGSTAKTHYLTEKSLVKSL